MPSQKNGDEGKEAEDDPYDPFNKSLMSVRFVQVGLALGTAIFVVSIPGWKKEGPFALIFACSIMTALLTVAFYAGAYWLRRKFSGDETPAAKHVIQMAFKMLSLMEISVNTIQVLLTYAAGVASAALINVRDAYTLNCDSPEFLIDNGFINSATGTYDDATKAECQDDLAEVVCSETECPRAGIASSLVFALLGACLLLLAMLLAQRYLKGRAARAAAKAAAAAAARAEMADIMLGMPPGPSQGAQGRAQTGQELQAAAPRSPGGADVEAAGAEAGPDGAADVEGSEDEEDANLCGFPRTDSRKFVMILTGFKCAQALVAMIGGIAYVVMDEDGGMADLEPVAFAGGICLCMAVASGLLVAWNGLRLAECCCFGIASSVVHVWAHLALDGGATALLFAAGCAAAAVSSHAACLMPDCGRVATIAAFAFLAAIVSAASAFASRHAHAEYALIRAGIMPPTIQADVARDPRLRPPMPGFPTEQ